MRFVKFVIRIDKSGKKINYTCDENKLANYYGANPDAPHFLTPISFKKEVLDKYYNKPSIYSISDGYLSYGSKWGINIDNNHSNDVVVYLGDLGRIPYEEQQHWKIYEIGKGQISEVSYKRDFKAEYCSPSEPVLYFKEKFKLFNKEWNNKLGWYLFKPLNSEDEYHWKILRVPSEEQKEFDENILSLTKILIDSLNQAKMKEGLKFEKNDKSIQIFEKYILQKFRFKCPDMIEYLKNLQEIRSSGSAHRKASNYSKTYSKFDKGTFSKTFENIIIGAITFLNTLERLREKSNGTTNTNK